MLETTDTSKPIALTPEGTYEFTVKEIPMKKSTKNEGQFYFTFKFSYVIEGKVKTHTEFLMPWDLKPLLEAFGFKPSEKDKYVWDRYECVSPIPKRIVATIVHESDKKDPTKIRAKMRDIKAPTKEEIPF